MGPPLRMGWGGRSCRGPETGCPAPGVTPHWVNRIPPDPRSRLIGSRPDPTPSCRHPWLALGWIPPHPTLCSDWL